MSKCIKQPITKGYNKKNEINYQEFFVLVTWLERVRLLISLVAQKKERKDVLDICEILIHE